MDVKKSMVSPYKVVYWISVVACYLSGASLLLGLFIYPIGWLSHVTDLIAFVFWLYMWRIHKDAVDWGSQLIQSHATDGYHV